MWCEAFLRSLTIEPASGEVMLQTPLALAHGKSVENIGESESAIRCSLVKSFQTSQALAKAFLACLHTGTYKRALSTLTRAWPR